MFSSQEYLLGCQECLWFLILSNMHTILLHLVFYFCYLKGTYYASVGSVCTQPPYNDKIPPSIFIYFFKS